MRNHNFFTYILVFFFVSCKSDNDRVADISYDTFKKYLTQDSFNSFAKQEAEFILKYHYEEKKRIEAKNWLDQYYIYWQAITLKDSLEKKQEQDRFDSIGGYRVIKIDSLTKCNLFTGYYLLNRTTQDSSDLAFVARHMAKYLFHTKKENNGCSYPLMTRSLIYLSLQDYNDDESNYVSLCNITPTNYQGDVFVNDYLLKKKRN